MTQDNSLEKWIGSPAAQIATAIFIAAGMLGALGVRLLLHNQHIVNLVLLVAIAGASAIALLTCAASAGQEFLR